MGEADRFYCDDCREEYFYEPNFVSAHLETQFSDRAPTARSLLAQISRYGSSGFAVGYGARSNPSQWK